MLVTMLTMENAADISQVDLPDEAAVPHIRLLGMPLAVVTEAQAVKHIVDAAKAGWGGWVITANLDQLRLYRKRPELRGMYEQASVVTADGMPLVWASKLQKTPLPQRVAGSSMIFSLSQAAADAGLSLFLLGGNPGAAEKAAEELRRRYPNIQILATHCPSVGFENDPAQMQQMIDVLLEKRPAIVYVALGFPKQEKLIEKLRAALPGAWYLGIGISFSFVAGEIKRAPKWMQKCGVEWVHRMVQEPGRLAKRYLVHGIPFAATLFARAFLGRFRRKNEPQINR